MVNQQSTQYMFLKHLRNNNSHVIIKGEENLIDARKINKPIIFRVLAVDFTQSFMHGGLVFLANRNAPDSLNSLIQQGKPKIVKLQK